MKSPSHRRKYPKRFMRRPQTLDVPTAFSNTERWTAGEIVRITGYNRNPAGKIVSMTAERGQVPKVLSVEEWEAFVRGAIEHCAYWSLGPNPES